MLMNTNFFLSNLGIHLFIRTIFVDVTNWLIFSQLFLASVAMFSFFRTLKCQSTKHNKRISEAQITIARKSKISPNKKYSNYHWNLSLEQFSFHFLLIWRYIYNFWSVSILTNTDLDPWFSLTQLNQWMQFCQLKKG